MASGDNHRHGADEIPVDDRVLDGDRAAVEFLASSITSGGDGEGEKKTASLMSCTSCRTRASRPDALFPQRAWAGPRPRVAEKARRFWGVDAAAAKRRNVLAPASPAASRPLPQPAPVGNAPGRMNASTDERVRGFASPDGESGAGEGPHQIQHQALSHRVQPREICEQSFLLARPHLA